MKHIHTTATTIGKIKRKAKEIQATDNITRSEALEIAAKELGYDHYHHATKCLAASQQDAIKEAIKTVILVYPFDMSSVSFSADNLDRLYEVTERLDDVVAENDGGFGDMTLMSDRGLKQIILHAKKLTKEEPAFIDGYAHWIGALITLGNTSEAVEVGLPVYEGLVNLLETAPKNCLPNYYDIDNRPFYRLAHNLVLALYHEGRDKEAKKIAKQMLKFNKNDNTGFRFLLDGIPDEF